jgi:hypothetical protein
MHDAQRVTRLVQGAEAREGKFHVPNFAQGTAAHDALVGQHLGGGGLLTLELGDGGSRGGSRSGRKGLSTGRLELVCDLAHTRQRVIRPGFREFFEIHVAIDTGQQPTRP